MKYETPELTALTPAINAIQDTPGVSKPRNKYMDNLTSLHNDSSSGYEDWE
jgi:hypothetical protein